MITITLKSKIQKVGKKTVDFSELLSISPQMLLEAIKKNNNLTINKACEELLLEQTRYKGVCLTIVKISNYRKEKELERQNSFYGTCTTDLRESYNSRHYYDQLRFGI